MWRSGFLAVLAVVLVACSEEAPRDRSAEVTAACETALVSQPGFEETRLDDSVRVERTGSGGWMVLAGIEGGDKTLECGVYAEGDANTSSLQVDGLNIR